MTEPRSVPLPPRKMTGPPPRQIPPRAVGPVLLTNMEARSADQVWTKAEWTRLCLHLHNENEPHHFVMGFQRSDGTKRYVRSRNLPLDRAISWAWASVAGAPKSRLAFVPYSATGSRSRWGGMDFDAHQRGQADRARQLALAAFRVLLNEADGLGIILEASGTGGWHLWAVSPEFRETRFWIQMFKRIASTIGAPVVNGVCELFPPDSLPQKFSKGMRAPGCWNPSNGSASRIFWENTRTTLHEVLSGKREQGEVLSGKSKTDGLISSELGNRFPDTKRNISFSSLPPVLLSLLETWSVAAPATRNAQLTRLVGAAFHQAGRSVARRLAELQHERATVRVNATLAEHLDSFDALWAGLSSGWTASLSAPEREALSLLATENERDAFRILRSYARKAEADGVPDFPVARDNLAERLGVTGKGAGWIRDRLAQLGVIRRTANFVPNKAAARYAWAGARREADE